MNNMIDKNFPPRHFLTNKQNSCGPDSILFILFYFKRGYFIELIQNSKNHDKNASPQFRNVILEPIINMYINKSLDSTVQKIVTKHITSKVYELQSGTEIWNLFTDAFEEIQFNVQTKYGKSIKNMPYDASYLYPSEINNPDNIISDATHLVYGDDDLPRKRDLRNHGFKMVHTNYELSAVLLFIGNGHYVSAIKDNEMWWYYDDTESKVKLLTNPENGLFLERSDKKMQMLFYNRIK